MLRHYIERYWSWDYTANQEMHMPTIPPGVGMDFFVHHRQPFVTSQQGKLSGSHLIFSSEGPTSILPSNQVGFTAIRFRTGMFKHFCNLPLAELSGTHSDAATLWGKDGIRWCKRINSTENFDDRVALLDSFLVDLLKSHKKDETMWSHVVRDLYYDHNPVRTDALAGRMRVSYRHFRRRFIEETGMAPKHFRQLVRFRSTLRPLLMNREQRYLSTALDNGYFDQMHFIKEFKHFMQSTPSDFLRENNFMSHFYYPGL